MEEIEGLTESSEEHIHEAAHEGHGHGGGPKWVSWVALTTALLAVVAAIAALLSGHNESESMLHQQQASDQWAYYQAKGIKLKEDQNAAVILARIDALEKKLSPEKPAKAGAPAVAAEGAGANEASDADKLKEKIATYKEEQEKISEKAKDLEADRDLELRCHKIYSPGITLLQIAIGIAAISVLTKKKRYFVVSLCFAAVGFLFFCGGLYTQFGPHGSAEEAKVSHEAAH